MKDGLAAILPHALCALHSKVMPVRLHTLTITEADAGVSNRHTRSIAKCTGHCCSAGIEKPNQPLQVAVAHENIVTQRTAESDLYTELDAIRDFGHNIRFLQC